MNDPTPETRPVRSVNPWLVLILTVLVLFLLARQFNWVGGRRSDLSATPRPITPRGNLAEDEESTIELFREASPSVVYITTSTVRRDRFSLNLSEIPRGSGTGFLYDGFGHVVTNFHVIQQANAARVMLADQSTFDAELVGTAPDEDLAVLRIQASADKLRPLPFGTSADLLVGQKVFAIGNPFGLDQTLTTGVISGLGREIQAVSGRLIRGVIQTDAAINPGNSGGPLLDSAGRLIGVNTAIYSPSGAYAGIGFAVPVDTVNRVVPQLIRTGKVKRPGLGVVIDEQIPRRLNVKGVLIVSVVEGGGADAAGLLGTVQDETGRVRLGDIILAINGTETPNQNALLDALESYDIGETVTVSVLRNGQARDVPVTLEER